MKNIIWLVLLVELRVGYKENEIIEFHSISSASRYFNVSHAAISKAIRRGNKCKGYNWKYKI